MALKTSILLLLVVVVSCNCKPFGWGGGVSYKGKLESNANANAEGTVGFKDGKLGGRGSAHAESGVDATGNLRSYVYAGGLGVRNDAGYDTGAKLSGDASGNGAIRKGDSLLSLKAGGGVSKSLTPELRGGVGGDIHKMSSDEIEDLNRLNRVNMLDNQVYPEKSATTKSYFK